MSCGSGARAAGCGARPTNLVGNRDAHPGGRRVRQDPDRQSRRDRRCASSAPAASWASARWPSTPRRTATACTFATPTRRSASVRRRPPPAISTCRPIIAAAADVAARRPSIPAMAFSPKTPGSPGLCAATVSSSSARAAASIELMGDKATARAHHDGRRRARVAGLRRRRRRRGRGRGSCPPTSACR